MAKLDFCDSKNARHKRNVAGSCRKSPFMQISQAFRPMSCCFEKLRRFLLSQPRLLHSLRALQNSPFRQQHRFEKYRSYPGPLRYCGAQGSLTPYHVPPRPVNSKGPGHRVSASSGSPGPGSLSSDPVPMLLRRCKGCAPPPLDPVRS